MNELPLSKFAPFTKDESKYESYVTNKLNEIGINCSNCIYLGKEQNSTFEDQKIHYNCTIMVEDGYNNAVCLNGYCKFFTNKEPIEDKEEDRIELNEKQEEYSSKGESSFIEIIEKLDFTNSNISSDIINLRKSLLNHE